jgi:DNA repair protein RadD
VSITLRQYQKEAIQALYTHFEAYRTNPILVLPTASGKSIILAEFMRTSGARCLLTSHVQELVQQDYDKLDHKDKGIYSAGLKRRDTKNQFIFASVQSIAPKAHLFEPFDLIIIDEAHRIPNRSIGQYRQLIKILTLMNPKLKAIGLTATPYRLDGGLLTDGDLFHRVAYEVPIKRLIQEKYLSPLISRGSRHKIDTTNIKVSRGEFLLKQLEEQVLKGHVTEQALDEALTLSQDRRSFLVFCVSVEHARIAKEHLIKKGIKAEMLTGNTPKQKRKEIIEQFKKGEIKALTNCQVLTTGFDAPMVDCLIMLRPTMSVSLFVQMCGRGMRIAPNKTDCLVLDYAGLIERHGPVDQVSIKSVKENGKIKKKLTKEPAKECPQCFVFCHPSTRECQECGFLFPPPVIEHFVNASGLDILGNSIKAVDFIQYRMHTKNGNNSLRIDYHYGSQSVSEFKTFNNAYGQEWWRKRANTTPPKTTEEALKRTDEMKEISHIKIKKSGKYWKVEGVVYK